MDWKDRPVLITGGASFIGSSLLDALMARGARVRVIDDLSSGQLENISHYIKQGRIEFMQADLRDPGAVERAVHGMSIVLHLAADHGGRGYVDLHQAACATNLMLDGMVFRACHQAKVDKVVYASSGCVYPNHIQTNPDEILYLTEDMVGPPFDADNMYGWAKLMAEMTLRAYYKDWGMKSASCRYFTVYGPRGVENHAVIAMIARAFVRQDPFVVWGTGQQVRNWTYIDDIVSGTILAAEHIDDGTAVNLGTMERIKVIDAVHEILRTVGYSPKIELHPEMPTGPLNRVADNSLTKRLIGWEPQVMFMDGLHRTMKWYAKSHDIKQFRGHLALLRAEGFTVEGFEELEARLRSKHPLPDRYVVLTLDDGHESSMCAADLLAEHGCRATFFLTRDRSLSKSGYLRAPQILELRQRGFSLGTHGTSHKKLSFLPEESCVTELKQSKQWLEDTIGEPVRYMAAPGGFINARVLQLAHEQGYILSGTCNEWMNSTQTMVLPGPVNRVNIRQHFSLEHLRHIVEGRLSFYLWRQVRAAALAIPKQLLRN